MSSAEELEELISTIAAVHQPRRVSTGELRCVECAEYYRHRLRRAKWPCRTARIAGIGKEDTDGRPRPKVPVLMSSLGLARGSTGHRLHPRAVPGGVLAPHLVLEVLYALSVLILFAGIVIAVRRHHRD